VEAYGQGEGVKKTNLCVDVIMTPYIGHALQIDFGVLKSRFLFSRPIFSGSAS